MCNEMCTRWKTYVRMKQKQVKVFCAHHKESFLWIGFIKSTKTTLYHFICSILSEQVGLFGHMEAPAFTFVQMIVIVQLC